MAVFEVCEQQYKILHIELDHAGGYRAIRTVSDINNAVGGTTNKLKNK